MAAASCGKKRKAERALDQFFTTSGVASACISHLEELLGGKSLADFQTVLEPSFGTGSFVRALRARDISPPQLVYIDIDSRDESHRADFLTANIIPWHSERRTAARCLTVGNPPFGKNSSLAVAFFNRAAKFSDVIGFILPRTFCKASVQNKLDRHFFLLGERGVPYNAFIFEGKPYDVPCVFQVWSYDANSVRPLFARLSRTKDFTFVARADAPDLAIRRVGANAGRLFERSPQDCSEQSHLFLRLSEQSSRQRVILTLQSLDLENAPVKFNTAGCPSISKSELCELYIKACS